MEIRNAEPTHLNVSKMENLTRVAVFHPTFRLECICTHQIFHFRCVYSVSSTKVRPNPHIFL